MCVVCLPHRSVTSARGGPGVTDHSSGFDSPPHLRPSGPTRIVPKPPAGRHLVLRRACVPGCGLLPVGHGSQRPGPWAPQEDQPCRRMAQGRGLLHLRRALCHFSAEAGACPGRSQQGHEPESGLAPGHRPACPPTRIPARGGPRVPAVSSLPASWPTVCVTSRLLFVAGMTGCLGNAPSRLPSTCSGRARGAFQYGSL